MPVCSVCHTETEPVDGACPHCGNAMDVTDADPHDTDERTRLGRYERERSASSRDTYPPPSGARLAAGGTGRTAPARPPRTTLPPGGARAVIEPVPASQTRPASR